MIGQSLFKASDGNFAESCNRSSSSNLQYSGQEESVIARPLQFLILIILLSLGAAQTQAQAVAGPVPARPSSPSSNNAAGSAPAAPQSQSTYQGSVPGKLEPGVLQLSLQDAIDRGLKTNLGLLLSDQNIGSARGQRWQKLSSLDLTPVPA
jgi:hypothetical protein